MNDDKTAPRQHTVAGGGSSRIEWLEVLQGFSMLLVVLGHISLDTMRPDDAHPLEQAMERVIYSFHMPLFIFISGWLFQLTCLGRDTTYGRVMIKKLKRLGVPFIVFTVITMGLKLMFPHLMQRPVDLTEILNTFVLFSSNPLGEMWFIITLMVLMALFPLYRWLSAHSALLWGLCAALLIGVFFPDTVRVFYLSTAMKMLPYFVAGILCCRYGVLERFASRWSFFLFFATAFVTLNVMELADGVLPERVVKLLKAFTGTGLSISVCAFLTRLNPRSFSSFRRYTFQIFLLGIFFQMAVRYLYARIGHISPWVYPGLFAASILAGIYLPVIISRIVERYFPRLRQVLGL